MLECNRRQKVVDRSKGLTVLQCVNRRCEAFGKEVNEEACSLCVVRSFPRVRPCKESVQATPPAAGQVQLDTQEVIEMMKAAPLTDIEDLLALESGVETSELSPEYPAMTMQIWLYKEALLKWNKAGRPTRTDEEVKAIHEKFCTPCAWYDKDKKRCKGCGCKVTVGAVAVLNKLKMATEHCPKELW